MKNILITGGAGYVGSILTPKLLMAGYHVTVYDAMYYGNFLEPHPRLRVVEADIRDTEKFYDACWGIDVVLHLACISNDPSFELDDNLSVQINYDCFEPLLLAAKRRGVRRFVYCSSSSVYGVSEAPEVTEEHDLVPLTLYNRYKAACEPILFKHQSPDFTCVAIRPATLCGYSPRMRLDLSVNILTNHAVNRGGITVFGGEQRRPNLHIQDMCDLYELMIKVPEEKIAGQIFNVGQQNMKIRDIAEVVRSVVEQEFPEKAPIGIETTPSDDIRSYHINSDKIANRLEFRANRTVEDAVRDLCAAFRNGLLPNSLDDSRYFNVKTLKNQKVG